MRKTVWEILNYLHLGGIVQLFVGSGLKDDGWFKSYRTKKAIDNAGKPIPWCTYSFIKFIETRLKNDFSVFEYGCGNSTLWYAEKVKDITSVEHNKLWFEIISEKLPENSKIVYRNLVYGGDYSKEVLFSGKKYNIVIIDGRDRNNSAKNAISALTDDGIIVFDNTDRAQYKESQDFLIENKFKHIDFTGLSPVTAHNNTTSIFYRNENCLGI